METLDKLKRYWATWLWPDATRRIITVNTLVWMAVALVHLVNTHAGAVLGSMLALPASTAEVPSRLWTLFTYMVVQFDFLHLLVNMLWLLLFGQMIEHAKGPRATVLLYVAGGLAGGLAFIIANAIVPGPHTAMLGSSCAVAAVISAAALIMPRWRVNLMLLGEVKIVWVAVTAIAMFLFTSSTVYTGIAHAAGCLAGAVYGLDIKYGRQYFRRPPKFTGWDVGNADKIPDDRLLDLLLDKVNRSGYSSLSPAERQQLFELSQRMKK